ncbi:PREDICTED: RING-H2 finger protein ATL57-like [Nelumbo nucifera]|uniref:RING-H2 finger protein ATL57-like n=2 Tax=Nelumbo nucifera TaxID=4432 RepID=A0A1U8Q885_NELNU|nr:PREDICTED: RING-H2 finger protein ATL57-like [Nelumbo nucifera]
MALTVVVLLTSLFFMGFFSIYNGRFAEENALDFSRSRGQAFAAVHLRLCVECLSEFNEAEAVKAIPYCGHVHLVVGSWVVSPLPLHAAVPQKQ